jgi:hypothetical protein
MTHDPIEEVAMAARRTLAALAVLAVLAGCSQRARTAGAGATPSRPRLTTSAVTFGQAMRKLWEDHITWTRLYIVSVAAGLPDVQATAGRLLRNQADIGNAIKPYYGEAAGARLTELLREHVLGAADLLAAAKAGDAAKVERAKAAWYANADQIAEFLSRANPANWPLEVLRRHMRTHLDLTLQEATARLEGRYADDIALYDRVHEAILELADALASGIVAQFPDRFA